MSREPTQPATSMVVYISIRLKEVVCLCSFQSARHSLLGLCAGTPSPAHFNIQEDALWLGEMDHFTESEQIKKG